MKKIFSIFAVLATLTLVLSGCQGEEVNTDQYEGTSLASYGPNPVMRGGYLTFYGANLDKVVEAIFPEGVSSTDIEVIKSGNPSEIRVKVPADGVVEGKVQLVTSDGKTLTTKSKLSYSEPIVLDSFSPKSAMPGDIITIEGDYMNLVTSVIFADEVTVAVNEGATRYKLTVTVPANAVTGTLILSDGQSIPNLIYSTDELTIGDPTVSGLSVATAKAGEDAVISGEYLQMIETVTFTDGVTVDASEFTYNEDYTTLTVTIPAAAATGDVVCTSYAGKDFTAGEYTPVVPTNLSVSPEGAIKAGETVTISGENLDVVSSIDLNGASGISFTYNDDGTITFEMPAEAADGSATLSLSNGESVSVDYTVVHPAITAVTPTEIVAGASITITGTDLDLVDKVELNGAEATITNQSETEITATTSTSSTTGTVVVTAKNGDTSESSETITVSYDTSVIIETLPESVAAGASMTMTGLGFNWIESITIGDQKVISYSVREDGTYTFIVPAETSAGYQTIHLVLTTGEEIDWPVKVLVTAEYEEIVIWEGLTQTGSWGGNQDLAYGGYDWSTVAAGSTVRVYFTCNTSNPDGWWYLSLRHGDSWGHLPETIEYNPSQTDTYFDYVLTQEDIDDLIAHNGLVVQGYYIDITKISLIVQVAVTETTVWTGSEDSGESCGTNIQIGDDNDLWINNNLTVGQSIRIYFTTTDEEGWQIQVFGGHWGSGLATVAPDGSNQFNQTNSPTALSDGYVSFAVTDDNISVLTEKSWWGGALYLQGNNVIFTKITIAG